jgi:L-alanine-DL-glutamate epimerase-like enolase superfamily enzyme
MNGPMKITTALATTHNVPVHVPLLEKTIYRPIVFVAIETDEGITGYGLTGGVQRFGIKELINRELAPFLIDRDPLETEALWRDMCLIHNPRSQTGAWSSAVSAVDIALWDIKGKHYREPAWRLMGGAKTVLIGNVIRNQFLTITGSLTSAQTATVIVPAGAANNFKFYIEHPFLNYIRKRQGVH